MYSHQKKYIYFRVDGKHFEKKRSKRSHTNHVISWPDFPANINPKWPVIVEFLNSSVVVLIENIWCVFRVPAEVWTGPRLHVIRMYLHE